MSDSFVDIALLAILICFLGLVAVGICREPHSSKTRPHTRKSQQSDLLRLIRAADRVEHSQPRPQSPSRRPTP
jgi:hypothetical protein